MKFQSTPLREGRLHAVQSIYFDNSGFQSTPLREGRPCVRARPPAAPRSFNPRPCARGDPVTRHSSAPPGRVSIHAPARGATSRSTVHARRRMGFNPRPCARGDLRGRNYAKRRWTFQSTPLREGRRHIPDRRVAGAAVSIHAPARGATNKQAATATSNVTFQSTPLREGRRVELGMDDGREFVSIHAPARGATASTAAI